MNYFAKEKNGNLLLVERKFLKLALISPSEVAVEQISWIKKNREDLTIIGSKYRESRINSLKSKMLEVQDYDLEQLKEFKEKIADEYRADILAKWITKSGSFSKNKFEQICQQFGLQLQTTVGSDKKNRYSITEVEGVE